MEENIERIQREGPNIALIADSNIVFSLVGEHRPLRLLRDTVT